MPTDYSVTVPLEATKRIRLLQTALRDSPLEMTLANRSAYERVLELNQGNPAAQKLVEAAAIWARVIEGRIAQGHTLAQCAGFSFHLANNGALDGAGYIVAIHYLAKVWIHGKELCMWDDERPRKTD